MTKSMSLLNNTNADLMRQITAKEEIIKDLKFDFISLELFQEGNKFVLGLFQIPLVFTPHGYTIKVPERNELFFLQEDKICLQFSKSEQLVKSPQLPQPTHGNLYLAPSVSCRVLYKPVKDDPTVGVVLITHRR